MKNKSLLAGLIVGVVALLAFAGSYQSMNHYGGTEAQNRAITGFQRMMTVEQKSLGNADPDSVLGADSGGVWCKIGSVAGRDGKLWRFNRLHVSQWKWRVRNTTAADAACSLYVFSGEIAGHVDSTHIYACADTMIVPMIRNVLTSYQNAIESEWIPLSIDSILVSTGSDSIASFEIWAVGDSF